MKLARNYSITWKCKTRTLLNQQWTTIFFKNFLRNCNNLAPNGSRILDKQLMARHSPARNCAIPLTKSNSSQQNSKCKTRTLLKTIWTTFWQNMGPKSQLPCVHSSSKKVAAWGHLWPGSRRRRCRPTEQLRPSAVPRSPAGLFIHFMREKNQ